VFQRVLENFERTNIINIVGQSHPNLKPKFRIILARGDVHCAKDPGADVGAALDDVMKNEKTYGKENTFRILEPAYAELKSDYRREFRKLRGKNVYELNRPPAPRKPSQKKVAKKEFEYYKFFANMTVTNLAARNNITSYLIKRVRAFNPSYQRDPGGFVRRIFDTKEFVSVVLDSVYLFFTKTFRDAEFRVTFWTPRGRNKISVVAYKYPQGERCATFDRRIVVDTSKSAAGYAFSTNEILLIPDVNKTYVPFEFFYAGQEKKKNIRSMACFPVSGTDHLGCPL